MQDERGRIKAPIMHVSHIEPKFRARSFPILGEYLPDFGERVGTILFPPCAMIQEFAYGNFANSMPREDFTRRCEPTQESLIREKFGIITTTFNY
jgi:hypothetical protein